MNSSCDTAASVMAFEYPALQEGASSGQSWPWAADDCAAKSNEQELANARAEGRREGECQARDQFEHEMREVRAALGTAIHEFTEERAKHLRALEGEAVKLAMSISRRLLRRESQVDPSLLRGLVRSALSELADTSKVRLYVHPVFLDVWKEHFEESQSREERPVLIADVKLHRHQCRIESSMGSTVVSLESGLQEIENGLFDLLSASLEQRTELAYKATAQLQ